MSLLTHALAFLGGLVIGAGALYLYIQYTMYSQIGKVEEQMDALRELQQE